MWNEDETNMTNIPKEKKFVGELGKKLNQVVGSKRVEMSTVVGCANATGEKMQPLIIHKGGQVPANMDLQCPLKLQSLCHKEGVH